MSNICFIQTGKEINCRLNPSDIQIPGRSEPKEMARRIKASNRFESGARHSTKLAIYCNRSQRQRQQIPCNEKENVKYQILVVRNPGEEIEQFVVWDAVRPEELAGEFVDAPAEDEVTERDGVEQERGGYQQRDGQVRQEWHAEVERAAIQTKRNRSGGRSLRQWE